MKNILIGITALLVVGAIGFYLIKGGNSGNYKFSPVDNSPSQGAEILPTASSTSAEKVYTFADVILHDSEASCWSVVNDKVYDLTAWISKHPGGSKAILSICGKDGTSAFVGQHEGDSKPEEKLATFYLGALTR